MALHRRFLVLFDQNQPNEDMRNYFYPHTR